MYFVGREAETRQLVGALRAGRNSILSGKFGIGRTALARHAGDQLRDSHRFIFLDGQQTPALLCRRIVSEYDPRRGPAVSYKTARALVRTLLRSANPVPVLVLDNLVGLSHPKIEFLRLLSWGQPCRFIFIVESFLPRPDLFRLRAMFQPVEEIHLGYLPLRSSKEYFRHESAARSFGWREADIDALAQATGGYPLNMAVCVQREADERKSAGSP